MVAEQSPSQIFLHIIFLSANIKHPALPTEKNYNFNHTEFLDFDENNKRLDEIIRQNIFLKKYIWHNIYSKILSGFVIENAQVK